MALLEKMLKPFGGQISICETCEHFTGFDSRGNLTCKAYDGVIPEELKIYSEDMKKRKCSDNYSYKSSNPDDE